MEDDMEIEIDEDTPVEEALDVLRSLLEQALDFARDARPYENAVGIVESLTSAIDVLLFVEEKMGDVHFELDFSQGLH